ncbi:hypothetical protein DFH08DRAFT_754994 [Mycena albidolilacea]|uniref:Uncharacterized protein n=1 Tax=Mycena albidolilacea TaxID=1033008 RepID=A0AAD6ZCX9_9AGAR|nr:hypothetical protein DFH08DRAFT_754994 [Mycena albidolilacea]
MFWHCSTPSKRLSQSCLPALRGASRRQCESRSLVLLQLYRAQSTEAALGVRSHLPPDTPPDPKKPLEISDQEWELRTGRAIYVIQQTLPEFFTTGLITSINKSTGSPRRANGGYLPLANANPLDYYDASEEDVDSIYSPNVRLSYTPPVALPAPFPKTLHIEGMSMYITSSVFVRHTLNALYSDLKVVLNKVSVETPRPSGDPELQPKTRRKSREKSLFVGLTATGVARVSGAAGEWEVNSTYTFSPLTGLIHIHTVNSIHPAPHQAVYDSLRASLGNVFGSQEPSRPDGAASAVKASRDSGAPS